jgi:hypothetical protein
MGAPLAAQHHAVILTGFGGGYAELTDLNGIGGPDFRNGYAIGGSAGFQFSKAVGVHADFAWTRATARLTEPPDVHPSFLVTGDIPGATTLLNGVEFHRYFYGAHIEVRHAVDIGLAPFFFVGGGVVTVAPAERSAFETFTRPAAMMGGGLFYAMGGSPIEMFFEGKVMLYRWDTGGFDRAQGDVTYAAGLSYRIPVR